MALSRVVARQAQLLITLAHTLGFTPSARRSLGFSMARPQPRGDNDPWAALKLIDGGRDPA